MSGTLDPLIDYCGAAAFSALAVLTRGLIGGVFPVGVIVAFITITRGWPRWRETRPISSTLIFLAIAAPWHVLAELRAWGRRPAIGWFASCSSQGPDGEFKVSVGTSALRRTYAGDLSDSARRRSRDHWCHTIAGRA